MKRLDTDISAVKPALQQAPEVFEGIGVNRTINVGYSMIDDLVGVLAFQPFIRFQFIAIECSARFHMLLDFGLQSAFLPTLNYHGADFPVTLQDSHDRNLILG